MNANEYSHKPVLLEEVLVGIQLQPDGVYVDATFGRGGHSKAILQKLNQRGRLLAFDKDPESIIVAQDLAVEDIRVSVVHASFSELEKQVDAHGLLGRVDGILFDLGVSSPQLDDAGRGFSFLRDGELDMRMNPAAGISAAEWLNTARQEQIASVLREFGEERFAGRIARTIVETRGQTALTRTGQLAELIAAAVPFREKDKHPATRSFQAIRIFINNELGDLRQVLDQVINVLRPGGRLAVISFHSLEDRIVKRFMREQSVGDIYPPEVPVTADQLKPQIKLIGKAIKPGAAEIAGNARARSAVLRIAEKLAA